MPGKKNESNVLYPASELRSVLLVKIAKLAHNIPLDMLTIPLDISIKYDEEKDEEISFRGYLKSLVATDIDKATQLVNLLTSNQKSLASFRQILQSQQHWWTPKDWPTRGTRMLAIIEKSAAYPTLQL